MDITIWQYLTIGMILLLGSMLQGVVGFASGLFSIPLLLLIDVEGLNLSQAIAINLIASAVQSVLGAWKLNNAIAWRTTIRPIGIRFVAIPAGAVLLWLARDMDRTLVKQVIGAILLVVVAAQVCWRFEPRESLHAGWEWFAFTLSGIMAGFCGMGGPPMVLWVLAHRWSSARARGFLFYLFIGGIVPQCSIMLWLFGWPILKTFGMGLLLTPFAAAGAICGLAIGSRLPVARLRMLTFVVLVLIALSSIVSPWF